MFNCQKQIIAIIDSGIGGVSVLKQLLNTHKAGNYIYFADNQFMPYGNKTKEWLTARLDYIINYLKEYYKVDTIIIACNTASTCIYNKYDNVITMQFNSNKTYFATSLTRHNLVNFNVIGDTTLAKQIENNIFNPNDLERIIYNHVKRHKLNTIKEFVLGCTHYELAKSIFDKYCPNSKIVNNSSYVVNNVQIDRSIKELNVVVILSKKDIKLENTIHKLLKQTIN